MRNTIITLASVAALSGAANAQTFTNFELDISIFGGSKAPASWAKGNGSTNTITSSGDISSRSTRSRSSLGLVGEELLHSASMGAIGANAVMETITNTITGLTPGESYTYSFIAAASGQSGVNGGNQLLEVTFDGVSGGTYNLSPSGSVAQRYEFSFIADADGNSNVELFTGISSAPTNGYNSLFVVGGSGEFAQTTSVPEPSSTALLGLGALGLLARRKR